MLVCLEHGRFLPCRKKGAHRTSSDPQDIEKVRYHQEVSSRDQRAEWKPPEYEEIRTAPADCCITLAEEYGSPVLQCGEMVLQERATPQPHSFLVPCGTTFIVCTPEQLYDEMISHFSSTRHYQRKG